MFKFKKQLIIILILIFLLPVFVSAQTQGQDWQSMISDFFGGFTVEGMIRALFFGWAVIASMIAQLILNVALDLLNWVVSPGFIMVSMTGADNFIVSEGWNMVRQLANVVVIFALVAVAISIILGYEETRAKKALVNFIIIALLINFTPVICGLFIDASNILMTAFLKGGASFGFSSAVAEGFQKNMNASQIPALLALVIFTIISSVVYFLYAILFLARYVVLWLLVIVSPIAFASKAFPESRYIKKVFPSICYWDDWWDTFLSWCVIGIPASFSILLSNKLMNAIANNPEAITSTPTGDLAIFGAIFSYLIPVLFLIIGFMITMSSGGPVGAKLKGWGNKAFSMGTAAGTGAALGVVSGVKAGSKEGVTGSILGGLKGGYQGVVTGGRDQKEELKNWATRQGERLGAVPKGTTNQTEEEIMKKEVSRMKALSKKEREGFATGKAFTATEQRRKYAAMMAQLEEKELGDKEINEIVGSKKSIEKAKSWGFDTKKLAKYAPEHAFALTGKSTKEVLSTMEGKTLRETVRSDSLKNFDVYSGMNEKQVANVLDFGNEIQRKNMQSWLIDSGQRDKIRTENQAINNERNQKTITPERKAELERIRKENINKIRSIHNSYN
jgi:hypothetical protein